MGGNIKIKLIILLLLTIFTFLIFSCKLFRDEEDFQNYDNLREITHWTVDTLELPGVEDMYLRTFWGSSADDLYVVGHSSEGLIGAVWHYDGNEWTPIPLHYIQGGEIDGWIRVEDIWGFGEDDVYIVGVDWTQDDDFGVVDSSFVVHYDGTNWKEIKVDNYGMTSIGGTGPNDIWLGGWTRGNLSHWNGEKWKNYNDVFPEELYYGIPSFEDITQGMYNKTYAIVNNYNVFPYLVSTKGTEWKIEHTFDEFKRYRIHLSEDGTLYSFGLAEIPLKIWNNGQWQPLLEEENMLPGSIFGLDNDNLLIAGWEHVNDARKTKVIHYNGTDTYIFDYPEIAKFPYAVWSDGNEIFIASYVAFPFEENKPHKTTIIHGR